jgi:hypothetical protein
MDRDGFIIRIGEAEELISERRRCLDTEGREADGRLRYHEGMEMADGALGEDGEDGGVAEGYSAWSR